MKQRTYWRHGQHIVLTHLPRKDGRNYEVEHANARGVMVLHYRRTYVAAWLLVRGILRSAKGSDHRAILSKGARR